MQKKTLFIITLMTSLVLFTSYSLANATSKLETLYGIQFNNDQLEIKVKSTGCTKPEHFKLVTKNKTDYQRLAIIRTKADRCRAMPRIIDIVLDLPVGEKMPYRLENLLQSGSQ